MITGEDIEKLGRLAKLSFSNSELERYTQELNSILKVLEQIPPVDTQEHAPLLQPLTHPQLLRDDVVTEKNQREFLQKNSSEVVDGVYCVPRVIEG